MFTLAAFAPVVARRANSLNTVAGAGLLLLVLNPLDLFNPSFQLTFLSVVAIVCITLPLLENMRRVGACDRRCHSVPPLVLRVQEISEALFGANANGGAKWPRQI